MIKQKGNTMRINSKGFSVVEALVVLVVVLAVAGTGYLVYAREHKTTPNGTTTTSTGTTNTSLASPSGTGNSASDVAGAINGLVNSLNTNENTLENQYSASDQSSDSSLNAAATNLGGVYNANNYN